MKIVVSGGGTGGHIYPALAFIRSLQQNHRDTQFLYIGTEKGLESKLVPRENIPFKAIEITGFKRSLSLENFKTVYRFLKGVKDSKAYLKEFQPDVVIGTGGYVSGPVVYAAAKLGIPTIIHEQNSVPGLTNKFLSRYVDYVATCFESSHSYFPADKVVLTGNPRATEVVGANGKGVLERFGLSHELPTVLIFSGSRGARPINEAVVEMLKNYPTPPFQVLYVTGDAHYEQVQEKLLNTKTNHVSVVPFIHNMPEVLASVDLVVSRAGATTLAELTALGVPSILIPSPYVTNNHQEKNARALTEKDAAMLILENELTSERLYKKIESILSNEKKLALMKKNAKALGIPDASNRLYNLIQSLTK
ncbi:undecaprenyldiphospho-muramoylpentapeptide beta-N-acetylglucosaminyltransferase [Aeribacillus pallidus]|uniref:undecaprenyldiphospho-muramoylpentapeptide beta-N-acetylglucosaminyltransferase n=1 Tax=Aeribacillus pallidus TaxID=33936 RepID=UPI001D5CE153|nr:undecaprenyldiphospho-muramoylpentapeptide beta-N-acetylglucosaminyltransferase [Bacillus sp. (in: firmicutes)]